MTGRSLLTHIAAADEKRTLAIGEAERPRRAVSLLERDLGDGVGRTEFVTNSDGNQDDLWPSLHAWPDHISGDLLKAARRWLQNHPDLEVVATSCAVDRSRKPILCVFMLHHVSSTGGPAAATATGEGNPPASVQPSSLTPAAPITDHCRIAGCGE
jgi:hypothetical protein